MQDSRSIWHARISIPTHRHFDVGIGRLQAIPCWLLAFPTDAKDTFLVTTALSLPLFLSLSGSKIEATLKKAQLRQTSALPSLNLGHLEDG